MKIKKIEFMLKIRHVDTDHINVFVDKKDCYKYIIDDETSQNVFE